MNIFAPTPYFDKPEWHLYDLSTDLLEKNNPASQKPEKLQELIHDLEVYTDNEVYIEADGDMLMQIIGPEKFYEYKNQNQ